MKNSIIILKCPSLTGHITEDVGRMCAMIWWTRGTRSARENLGISKISRHGVPMMAMSSDECREMRKGLGNG